MLNLTETVAAAEKATELGERFSAWVWAEPARASTLARRYNDIFNAITLRSYDGHQRDFPGLALTITLREHQIAAVARIVSEPSVLLAHEVGAGKTLEMVVGAMELRRLGMARKPAIVVPNHMLEQFSREWLQAYPQSRVLAAGTEDLAGEQRRVFVARIATGDWDGVILSRTAFERLPLNTETQQAYFDAQLDQLRHQLQAAKGEGGGLTVKRLQGALLRAEERLKNLADAPRDPAVSFEATGIDYLFVDEAQGFKNLRTVSNIPGVAIDGSQRSADLDMKLAQLRARHGDRVACFATATPIANSIAEAYTMQRYLRPDVLDAAGLVDFDRWAATFGEVVSDLELSPSGSGFKMKSRFAKFRNVPELLRMWWLFADVKTAEDLDLPTPAIVGGQTETVVVPPTDALRTFMAELAHRAELVQSRGVDPTEDNMLRITTHGRLASLDPRLVGEPVDADATLLAAAARRIAACHHTHAQRRYPNNGTPGALQLVFCDLGTPTSSGWNAYDELKRLLARYGVPGEKVRYMHEARNDRQKGELFAAARTGQVAVLVGSTEKMGVGTNVQDRAVALHHLDCPWRPDELTQRDGRILRQGNFNDEVEITRYVVESSFAPFLWQTVERKARFIGQIMRGRLDVREIEDISDTALSYSEVKALATGNPKILDKARADAEITRLERLHRAWQRDRSLLSATIASAEHRLPILAGERDRITEALTRYHDTHGDAFTMTVAGARHAARADAAIALRSQLARIDPRSADQPARPVAQLAGFDVLATGLRLPEPHLRLELAGVPRSGFRVELDELRADRPIGIVTRLENRAADLTRTAADITRDLERTTAERCKAVAQLDQPFQHQHALEAARERADTLAQELAATPDPPPDTQTPDAPDSRPEPGPPPPAQSMPPAAEQRSAGGPAEEQAPANRVEGTARLGAAAPASPHSVAGVALSPPQPSGTPPGTPAPEAHGRSERLEPVAAAGDARWRHLCEQLAPAVLGDPYWPELATHLEQAHRAGINLATTVATLTQDPLPDTQPALELHYRLLAATSPTDAQHAPIPDMPQPAPGPHPAPPAPPIAAPVRALPPAGAPLPRGPTPG